MIKEKSNFNMLPAPLNLIPISIAGVLTFVYYAERVYRHYVPGIGLVSKIASILWGQGGEEEGVCKAHKLVPRAASNAIVRCDPVFIF